LNYLPALFIDMVIGSESNRRFSKLGGP